MGRRKKQEPEDLDWLKEQLNREKRARQLLQGVAVAASDATSVDEILQVAVDSICARTGWPVGHVYIRSGESELSPSSIWHLADPDRYQTFREITESTVLAAGKGLPGRVMKDAKPAWIMDVHMDENFPRVHAARDIGVRAGFAFPVVVGKQVQAVMEFFSDTALEPDEQLLEVMANIGTALGGIIQQKWAENAVRESEMRFRSIAHSANDAIITADPSGNIISWNKGAERVFGYEEREVLGKALTIVIPERFREAHALGLRRMKEKGESRVIGKTVELAGLRRDGSEFPLELSLASWKLGENSFYSGIIRDISDRKLAEEKLRKFAEELERRVQEGINALREAERMAAYGNMVAYVAHEMRHPIFSIQATAYVLKDRIQDEEKFASQFSILERETNRMSRLMEDLLEFAKPPSLILSSVDPAVVLKEARDLFFANGSVGVQVHVDAGSELTAVRMDRDRILQVLLNLMNNAKKHATGLTAIRLSAEDRMREGFIRFRVQNDGVGIPSEYLPRIFDPFFTSGKGTGLGLAIVRRIILDHKGSIEAESSAENGTTFSFVLPLTGP